MPTSREIINLALKEATVLGVGQTALGEDMNDCFTLLTNMCAQWQKKRWLVPALMDISTVGNSAKSNPIGIGQYWNTPRPDKIQSAYMVQLNTGSNPISIPLTPIFSFEDYSRIAVKNLNSMPTHFFYDGAWPNGNVYIWPIPSSQYEIHLIVKAPLGFPTTLDTVCVLPPEYLEAIHYNLAVRMVSMYQVENPSQLTGKMAKISLNTIKAANAQIPLLKMPAALRRGKGFNLWNADGY